MKYSDIHASIALVVIALLIWQQTVWAEEPVQPADQPSQAAEQAPQKKPQRSPYAGLTEIPKRYLDDAVYILSSPTRLDKNDIIPLVFVFGGTAGLMAADKSIRSVVQEDLYDEDFEETLKGMKYLGDGVWDAVICGGFYIGGLMFRDEHLKEIAIAGGEALLFAGGISQGIKNLTGRYRPETEKGPFEWRGPTTASSISFPSGHATMAFALASVIATEYDDNILIDIASYGTASLVAFERVYSDSHWTSDVFFGAAIGIAVGRSIVIRNKKKQESLALKPVIDIDRDLFGVALNKRF